MVLLFAVILLCTFPCVSAQSNPKSVRYRTFDNCLISIISCWTYRMKPQVGRRSLNPWLRRFYYNTPDGFGELDIVVDEIS